MMLSSRDESGWREVLLMEEDERWLGMHTMMMEMEGQRMGRSSKRLSTAGLSLFRKLILSMTSTISEARGRERAALVTFHVCEVVLCKYICVDTYRIAILVIELQRNPIPLIWPRRACLELGRPRAPVAGTRC